MYYNQDKVTDFNKLLRRTVQDGKQFEKLIRKSTCKVVRTGKGMTDYTVTQMAEVVKQYYNDMDKVAPLLKKSSLEATCYAIHKFCYDHFQYKIDETTQNLRAPGCSWYVRYTGIDCKSYSIIASSLLTCLGIKHYIRRVKQLMHNPNLWSHVYIVVPADQQSGNLAYGYYTIDGTIQQAIEPAIKQKDDLFMDMKHEVLAGAFPRGLSSVDPTGIKKIDLSALKGLVKGLDCIGGSSFKPGQLDENISRMNAFFNGIIDKINAAVTQNNMDELSKQVTMFKGNAGLFTLTFKIKKAEGWNSCTTANLDACIKISEFYHDTCRKALTAWLEQYFNRSAKSTATPQPFVNPKTYNESIQKTMGLHFTYVGSGSIWLEAKYNYTPKTGAIPVFVITPYVLEKSKGGFDPAGFLKTLVTTATTVGNVISTVTGKDSGGGLIKTDPGLIKGNLETNFDNKKIAAAGFGIAGYVLVALGLGYVFTQMKNTGPGAKKETATKKQ